MIKLKITNILENNDAVLVHCVLLTQTFIFGSCFLDGKFYIIDLLCHVHGHATELSVDSVVGLGKSTKTVPPVHLVLFCYCIAGRFGEFIAIWFWVREKAS